MGIRFTLNELWRWEGVTVVTQASSWGLSHHRGPRVAWTACGGHGQDLSMPACGSPPELPTRYVHRCLLQGVGGEIPDPQGPADPACGLCHHGPAYGDRVPVAECVPLEAAGPAVLFGLQQRLVRCSLHVRGWWGPRSPHLSYPSEGASCSPFSVFLNFPFMLLF